MSDTVRIPLLTDHHSHPLFYAAFTSAVNLQSVTTLAEAQHQLQAFANQEKPEIAIAHGWRDNQFLWPQSEFEQLPPAAVFNVSLHSLLINNAGLKVLVQRYGDAVQQIADREWYERNFRTVLNWFANLNSTATAVRNFFDQLIQLGVWSAEELLLVDEHEITLFDEAGLSERTRFWAAPDTFKSLNPAAQKRVFGLKLFTDGAFGSRTAAISRQYRNDPQNCGMLIHTNEQLLKTVEWCLDTGKAVSIHAIGDVAIEQCIATLKRLSELVARAPEVRIEHAQLISLEMATRAKKLGLILSMQPNFSSDSVDYRDRLDTNLCQANNPFRMLIDQAGFVCGKDLIFGSDGMPHGVEDAVRQSLFPTIENQRLTLDEFKAGYCLPDEAKGHIELELSPERINYSVSLK